MKTLLVIAALVAAAPLHAQQKFTAADVPGIGIHAAGRVVISNDHRAITAYRFFGDIREALVSIRSTPMRFHPFGGAVFNSSASVRAPMPANLVALITDSARTHGVDPRLVAAVASRESDFDARSVSRVGACGIMQLMPDTARFLGVTDIFDVRQNIDGGTRYLRTLLDAFHGDLDLALAAYNAGPGAVQKYGGIPPYRETQAYVKAVRQTYEAALTR